MVRSLRLAKDLLTGITMLDAGGIYCSDMCRMSLVAMTKFILVELNPIALRKAKIVCNFGFSKCIWVKL